MGVGAELGGAGDAAMGLAVAQVERAHGQAAHEREPSVAPRAGRLDPGEGGELGRFRNARLPASATTSAHWAPVYRSASNPAKSSVDLGRQRGERARRERSRRPCRVQRRAEGSEASASTPMAPDGGGDGCETNIRSIIHQ